MLEQLCKEHTDLTREDICQLQQIRAQLPLMADLMGQDVFLDCLTCDGCVMVVAQAQPSTADSAYRQNVVGEYALREKEPAVYHALQCHAPARDIKAVTQEDCAVRQDVVPVFNPQGRCIGALVREKDISGALLQEKKFRTLAQTYEKEDASLRSSDVSGGNDIAMREVHHRVKNNLQLVASVLNIQSRRCSDGFTKKILKENVGRILSIAAIHDILTKSEHSSQVIDSMILLDQLRKNLQSLVPDGKHIAITVSGSPALLSADTASAVSLVVNELIINALSHAFEGRDSGSIQISFRPGQLFHTVTVTDDGCGFDPAVSRNGSLGLSIIKATVRDRLRGQISIHSDSGGSRISFDIRTE